MRKATREAAADAQIGPGEYPTFWTADIDVPAFPPALSPALAANDSDGRVIRLSAAGKLGPIALARVEPGRRYKARFAFRRRTNSPDPANDGVRLAIRWFDQSRAPLADPAGTTTIQDIVSLTTGSGRQAATFIFAREAGAGVDFVAPAGARYGRPFVQTFGLGSVTDIEVIDCIDVTDASLWSPDVADLDDRLAAVESVDAGNRLDYLESVANDPETMTPANIGSLEAASVPAGVQSVTVLSGAADNDGLGGIYRRAAGVASIQSLDGAYWEERNPLVLEPDEPTAVAGLDARLPMSSRRVKQSIVANAPALINERILRELLFRRKKIVESPFYNSVLVARLATYGYPYLYPQAIAIDLDADELWVLSAPSTGAGSNDWGWFSVYSLSTAARKTTFTLGVKWSEMSILEHDGSSRFLWTFNGGSLVKADVTALPADGATLAPILSANVNGQNGQGCFDGKTFSLQTLFGTSGKRETFGQFDKALNKIGVVEFPAFVSAPNSSTYTTFLPKAQGVAAFRGGYVFGCGGVYAPGAEINANRMQGVIVTAGDGTLVETALCAPDRFLDKLGEVAGRALSIVENEGVYVVGGRIFECWMIQPVETRLTDGMTGGILITEVHTADEDAVDFASAAQSVPVPFDRLKFETQVYAESGQLRDPVAQTTLDSLNHIANMMRALKLSHYDFLGTNQALADVNGENIPNISGNLIECVNKGTSFDIWIKRPRDTSHYVISATEPRTQQLFREVPHTPGCGPHEVAANVLQVSSPWIWDTPAGGSSMAGALRALRVALNPQQRLRNFTRMGVVVSTAGSGTAHLGVYEDAGGRPGKLLVDAGTVSLASTGVQQTAVFPAQIFDYEAIYFVFETADASARVHIVKQTHGALGNFSGTTRSEGINRSRAFSATFPSDETASTYSNTSNMPYMWIQPSGAVPLTEG